MFFNVVHTCSLFMGLNLPDCPTVTHYCSEAIKQFSPGALSDRTNNLYKSR